MRNDRNGSASAQLAGQHGTSFSIGRAIAVRRYRQQHVDVFVQQIIKTPAGAGMGLLSGELRDFCDLILIEQPELTVPLIHFRILPTNRIKTTRRTRPESCQTNMAGANGNSALWERSPFSAFRLAKLRMVEHCADCLVPELAHVKIKSGFRGRFGFLWAQFQTALTDPSERIGWPGRVQLFGRTAL